MGIFWDVIPQDAKPTPDDANVALLRRLPSATADTLSRADLQWLRDWLDPLDEDQLGPIKRACDYALMDPTHPQAYLSRLYLAAFLRHLQSLGVAPVNKL